MTFILTDQELATADLAALTAGMTTIEKIEWCNKYTHRAANRQGQLVALYISGEVGHLGYDIDLPPATIDAMKVEVNALADRAVMAQSHIASVTD